MRTAAFLFVPPFLRTVRKRVRQVLACRTLFVLSIGLITSHYTKWEVKCALVCTKWEVKPHRYAQIPTEP